jgi:hypothetical protein
MLLRGSAEQLAALVVQPAGHPLPLGAPGGLDALCTSDDGVSNLKLYWWPHSCELRLVEDPEVRLDLLRRLGGLLPG